MNGFVKTLLSAALSWIRALINQIWNGLHSENGGALYRFFSDYWLVMVIGLCIICTLMDLLVYFFRWRPDYLWASAWRRMRRKRPAASQPQQTPPSEEAFAAFAQPEPEPELPTMAYAPLQSATAVYAPVKQPTQVWQPVQEMDEPLLDDQALWDSEEPMDFDWEPEEEPSFGSPQPEPLAYFRDVQAGFAPAIPPEQLYAPSRSYQPPQEQQQEAFSPVHPGLDDLTFRQTVGLDEPAAPAPTPVMRAPAFRPFTVTQEPKEETSPGALQRFAQLARGFIALDDEQKTIRDLQSNVDVSKAFHEPVYPQSFRHDEE